MRIYWQTNQIKSNQNRNNPNDNETVMAIVLFIFSDFLIEFNCSLFDKMSRSSVILKEDIYPHLTYLFFCLLLSYSLISIELKTV